MVVDTVEGSVDGNVSATGASYVSVSVHVLCFSFLHMYVDNKCNPPQENQDKLAWVNY
jgi:hypothetical protein